MCVNSSELRDVNEVTIDFYFHVQLIQVILQTLTIVDGLRRCSNSEKNQVERRAKNSLTFLIVTNLTMYIWETLETKNHGGQFKSQAHFYGDNVWVVLNHLTQPLSIFYRFQLFLIQT